MKTFLTVLAFMVLLSSQIVFGNVLMVDINGSGDFVTIQAAIDASVNGDTVLVQPGTYFENINYNGKNICVISSAGADSTIIDGSQPQNFKYRSVVTFVSGEDRTTLFSGFTITGGTGMRVLGGGSIPSRVGGGIICDGGSSPIIEYNIIRDNTASEN